MAAFFRFILFIYGEPYVMKLTKILNEGAKEFSHQYGTHVFEMLLTPLGFAINQIESGNTEKGVEILRSIFKAMQEMHKTLSSKEGGPKFKEP